MSAFRLGLTGSIGMGKTTTANRFREAGVPVWDADEAVHRFYALGGAALTPLFERFPSAKGPGEMIDRAALAAEIARAPEALADLEALVHPQIDNDRADFLAENPEGLVVLDIPLLFEKGLEEICDATLLVTAPEKLQRERVLARPGMTPALFAQLKARQMPDAQKRALADHILETLSLAATKAGVEALIAYLRREMGEEEDA